MMMTARVRRFSAQIFLGVSGLALLAQQAAAQAPASKPVESMTPAERAQRDADKVFHWIKLSADKTVVKPVAAPAPPPAPAPVRKAQAAPSNTPAPSRADSVAAAAPAPQPEAQPAAPESTLLAAAPLSIAQPPAPAPMPEPELPLKLLQRVEPVIPRQLLATLQSGNVEIRFTVQPDGKVRQAEAVRASHKRLGSAAVDAVLQWRFEPIPRPREATVELGFSQE
jgi:TonB family protein